MAAAQPGLVAPIARYGWLLGLAVLLAAYATIVARVTLDDALMRSLWFLPGVGALGATVANTSGTGGGVVFVPVFHILRELKVVALDPIAVTAASFLIQCFGMSMGAMRWTSHVLTKRTATKSDAPIVRLRDFAAVVAGVVLVAVPVMLVTQNTARFDPATVLVWFKAFSISLGIILLLTTWTINRTLPERRTLAPIDLASVMLLAVPGGFLTAYFSVGVGELVALYLFIRHYPIALSTGAACAISAISVVIGAQWHIIHMTVPWEFVVLAAPGAMIGGFLAKPLALWLGSLRLKTLDGLWIVLSSLYLIALSR